MSKLFNPAIGSIATLAVIAIAFLHFVPTDLVKPSPAAQMRTTCVAALSQNPDPALQKNGLTPADACDCLTSRIYPSLTEPTRAYIQQLYDRVEANAPTASYARTSYDADFGQRLQASFSADFFSNLGSAVQLMSEVNALGKQDLGPTCNALR